MNHLTLFKGLTVQIPGLSVQQLLKDSGFYSNSLMGNSSLLKMIPIIHSSVCFKYQYDEEAG